MREIASLGSRVERDEESNEKRKMREVRGEG
jgi:hypothetical protein